MTTPRQIRNGFFLTLEGPEGVGKSTHVRLVADRLRQSGYQVVLTREPGGTPLGEELRRLVKHFGEPGAVCAESELLMFGASRAQLMRDIILPHLVAGGVVICDRFADSTTVYQGCARNLDASFIRQMHKFTIGQRWPDLTIVLDLDPEAGLGRARTRGGSDAVPDRIEAESLRFHTAVRDGFLALARQNPERVRIVRTDAPTEDVHRQIMEIIDGVIGQLS
ncbi:MAG: dTMP kinase [Lentisphaerae bacterium RIFOXYB12_FULL_65_16]|nr:MAG: dTMP kinase [Lentisphaerae bacterium RIFOXYA12_64_32]OGV84271.1 MAG: dTMP kinase [Lentisphaerae bacterium RIFOXYB12_FULL_65_16]